MDVPVPAPVPTPPPPPTLVVPTPSLPDTGPLQATSGKRFANLLIDGFAVYLIRVVFVFGFYNWMNFSPFLGNLLIYFLYFVGLESLNGKTVAKYLTRTKVVATDGSNADFNHILIRTLCRYVPFDALSFLGGARPSGWHDRWSGTKVIEEK